MKKCAAKYNLENGKLDAAVAEKIIAAADDVIGGKLDDHFPLVSARLSFYTVNEAHSKPDTQ